jgi:dTDP-4-dehydrorhamnose 3,5-epimerase
VPFTFEETSLPGVIKVQPVAFDDERGFFMGTYRSTHFREGGIDVPFVQFNVSWSRRNVLRGLHYQIDPHPMGKLVHAQAGEIYDVVVDIRTDSPTYGRWLAVNLSVDNRTMLYVPPGFAHGFCVLTEEARIAYYCTGEYAPDHERGVRFDDPSLNIPWPIEAPVVSAKDRALPLMDPALVAERAVPLGTR